jgi:flavoprotein
VGDLKTWLPCLTCESGFYMKTAPGKCDGTGITGTINDRTCEKCKNCANLQYILSASKCPGNSLVDTTQCGACKSPCTYGQYIDGTLEV